VTTIAFTSAVYLGDVAPYLAVARRAVEAGHDAVVIAPEGFRSACAGEPFEFRPYALDCSPRAMHADPVHERLMRHPYRNAPRLGGYWMSKAFTEDPDAAISSLRAGLAGVDVLVTHPTFGSASIPVARSMGIPVVVGQLFPMMIPTGEWTPPIGSRAPRLPRPVNQLAWRALWAGASRTMGDGAVNAARAGLGQAAIRGAAGTAWMEADRTVILASSHYYGRSAADWPPVTWGGFAIWEPPGALDGELARFLTDGPPPVLVTLGTSAATGAAGAFRTMLDGLDRLGHRAVALVGGSVDVGDLAGRPGVVPFAPITQVLPHCSVAVVSGALGGRAAAMAAGVPIVVHPQLFDQVWNGRRVEELGLGLHVRRTKDVAAAAARVACDPGYRERARAFAALIEGEDGAAAVLDVVDDLLHR
jgi:UDP:flavonoid glycosyltransferase YjiC (YdhE family)